MISALNFGCETQTLRMLVRRESPLIQNRLRSKVIRLVMECDASPAVVKDITQRYSAIHFGFRNCCYSEPQRVDESITTRVPDTINLL